MPPFGTFSNSLIELLQIKQKMKKVQILSGGKKKLQYEECHDEEESNKGEDESKSLREPEIGKSKQSLLMEKKELKFEEDIDRCRKLILDDRIPKAIQILRGLIQENCFLDKFQFKASGNNQSWEGFYPKGPSEWFMSPKIQWEVSRNPFDYLSTCFMIQFHRKTLRIDEVIDSLSKVAQQVPNRYEMQVCLAHAYYNAELFVKAEEHYLRALQLKEHQKILEYMAWLKGYWFEADKMAVQYCEKCLQINPQNIGALYVKALCISDMQLRSSLLNKIIEKHPDYYRVYLNLGNTQSIHRKLSFYEKALSYDPNYAFAYAKKGQSLKVVCQAEARQSIAKAISIDPSLSFSYWCLGDLEEHVGNTRKAVTCYEKCLEINPNDIEATKSLAHIHRIEGNIGKCLGYYERYVEINPYDEDMYNYLGLVYDANDRENEAIECYLKATEINPQFFQGFSNLGLSYQQKEMYADAMDYYKKAYEIQQNGCLCYGIAICCKELGEASQAEKWALLSIEKGGDDDNQVYQFLGDLFKETGEHTKSIYWYLKHVEVKRTLNTDYIESNIIIKIPREQAVKILSALAMSIEETKDSLYMFLQIGRLLLRLQDYSKAMESYELAKQLFEKYYAVAESRRGVEIRRQLNKVFGDSSEGIYNLKDRVNFTKLKEDYDLVFKRFLGWEGKTMVEE